MLASWVDTCKSRVDFPIPGNDDAVRSVKVVLGVINNAICESRGLEIVDYISEEGINKDAKKEKLSCIL